MPDDVCNGIALLLILFGLGASLITVLSILNSMMITMFKHYSTRILDFISTQDYYEWLIQPFLLFWGVYFSIGLILYGLKINNVEWYKKLSLTNQLRNQDVQVYRLNFNVIFNLLTNVVTSLLGGSLFWWMFDYPTKNVYEPTNWSNMWSELKVNTLASEDVEFASQLLTYQVYYNLETWLGYLVIEWIIKLFVVYVVTEIWFYHVHGLFHLSSFLMKRIHAKHHRYTAPLAIFGLYCHPLEMLLLNVPVTLIGPKLVNIEWSVYIFYVVFASFNSLMSHDGTDWAIYNSEYHDLHHKHAGLKNLGLTRHLDWLYGTQLLNSKSSFNH